jgi:predicted transposase YdaD
MLTTILVYTFTDLSQREAEEMLGISLQETRFYREAEENGREKEGRSLILRQLNRRFGALPESWSTQITDLSLAQIESLAEALLDFQTIADLETWLEQLQAN